MPYTRRKLLQQAAVASLAGAAGSSLPFLTGGKQVHAERPVSGPPNPIPFGPGIRVFFIGCWLFSADPQVSGSMLAVTLDMPDPNLHHTFPYGVWPGDSGIDANDSLCPNPAPAGSPRNAYPITVQNISTTYTTASNLFQDAAANSSFLYLKNLQNLLTTNYAAPGIRVISLPIPTRIVTADFIPTSSISGSGDYAFTPGPCDSSGTPCGLAACHVFDYDGATSLSFNNVLQIKASASDYTGDFHFHTVPPAKANRNHAVDMFNNLLNVINVTPGQLTLAISNPDLDAIAGPYIPTTVDGYELDIPQTARHPKIVTMSTASCAAGGLGLGGGH
jgi:hypothetical protein